ncbi:MAG: XTP/dITP diphosphatase [Planctomycetia bacterium]|nr:XTP/dITP diphosphatase [Planctomycetia bacterium]
MPLVVLGTHNQGKVRELADLLSPLSIDVRSLDDFPGALEIVEDGATFRDNAVKKASQQAKHLKQWVLAEDSGLAVDALGGRPGVYSARYAGPDATDAENNQKLLTELSGVPPDERMAHYACHAALADPSGAVRAESVGTCQGRILTEEHGSGGFGYDPLFEVVEFHRTFGQLGPAVKAAISHRARALHRMIPQLQRLLQ